MLSSVSVPSIASSWGDRGKQDPPILRTKQTRIEGTNNRISGNDDSRKKNKADRGAGPLLYMEVTWVREDLPEVPVDQKYFSFYNYCHPHLLLPTPVDESCFISQRK